MSCVHAWNRGSARALLTHSLTLRPQTRQRGRSVVNGVADLCLVWTSRVMDGSEPQSLLDREAGAFPAELALGTMASSMYQHVVSTRSRHPPEGPDSMGSTMYSTST